jgi:protocatechuate 3,4-dioxygenase beta subunit
MMELITICLSTNLFFFDDKEFLRNATVFRVKQRHERQSHLKRFSFFISMG